MSIRNIVQRSIPLTHAWCVDDDWRAGGDISPTDGELAPAAACSPLPKDTLWLHSPSKTKPCW